MKFRLLYILIGFLVLIQALHAWLELKRFAQITELQQQGISGLTMLKNIEFYCREFNLASVVVGIGIVALVVMERRDKRKTSSLVQSQQQV